MARQLDFSPLDFRQAIMSDPAGKSIAGAISGVSKSVTGAIQQRQKRKEAIKKDFVDQMTFDTSITGNNIINNRIAYEYGKLRNKHTKILADRKGWLTPEDMINLRSDMQGLSSLANELKGIQSLYDTARNRSITQDGRTSFDLKTDNWGDLMGIISGENTTENLIGKLNEVKQSDTGFPFLDYKSYDINTLKNNARKSFRQQYKGDTKESVYEVEKNGKRYSTSKKVTQYGDEEKARDFFKSSFLNNSSSANFSKGLQNELNESQKIEALKKYGPESDDPSNTPYLDYYIKEVFNPEDFTQETEQGKTVVKPAPKGTKGGLTLLFGGGKAKTPNEYAPKKDTVLGMDFNEYVEFAKSGRSPKGVNQVTVTGAQLLTEQGAEPATDITEPADYKVIGYDAETDNIVLSQRVGSGAGAYYDVYMAPRKDNEHFLVDLFSEETLRQLENRAQGKQSPAFEMGMETPFGMETKENLASRFKNVPKEKF